MDHGERIAALETRMEHLEDETREQTKTLTEIRDVLLQAKGAKWLLIAIVSIGSFIGGLSHKILPFLAGGAK